MAEEHHLKPHLTINTNIQSPTNKNSENRGSFTLDPNSSGLRSPNNTLRQTKYQKLFKLYKNELDKKEQLAAKTGEIQKRKQKYEQMMGNQSSCQGGDSNSEENKKKIEELLHQLQGISDKKSGVSSAIEQNLTNLRQQSANLQSQIKDCSINNGNFILNHTQKQTLQRSQINTLKSRFQELGHSMDLAQQTIKNLQKQKLQIQANNKNEFTQKEQRLQSRTTQLTNLQKTKKDLEHSIQQKSKHTGQNTKIIGSIRNLGAELNQKEKRVKEIQQKLEKIRADRNKAGKDDDKRKSKAAKIQKQLHDVEDNLHKIRKQEKNVHNTLEKARKDMQEKVVEAPPQYLDLKAKNQALKTEIAHINSSFAQQQTKQADLVPPRIVSDHEHRLSAAKLKYQENRTIGEKLRKLQAQNKKLDEQKQELEWNLNPVIQNLDETNKKQMERIKNLEQQKKQLQKQSLQVSRKLEEYTKSYPDFQLQRKKKKTQKKQQIQKKEEIVDQSTKKKKNKNKDKSPELPAKKQSKSESVKSEKQVKQVKQIEQVKEMKQIEQVKEMKQQEKKEKTNQPQNKQEKKKKKKGKK